MANYGTYNGKAIQKDGNGYFVYAGRSRISVPNSAVRNQSSSSSSSSELTALQGQLAAQQKAHEARLAEAKAALEKARKEAEEAATRRAAEQQTASAAQAARTNQQSIGEQLTATLATPQEPAATPTGGEYTPSGFSVAPTSPQAQKVQGVPVGANISGVSPALATINEESGGTNQQQNKFTMPDVSGLTFGGI